MNQNLITNKQNINDLIEIYDHAVYVKPQYFKIAFNRFSSLIYKISLKGKVIKEFDDLANITFSERTELNSAFYNFLEARHSMCEYQQRLRSRTKNISQSFDDSYALKVNSTFSEEDKFFKEIRNADHHFYHCPLHPILVVDEKVKKRRIDFCFWPVQSQHSWTKKADLKKWNKYMGQSIIPLVNISMKHSNEFTRWLRIEVSKIVYRKFRQNLLNREQIRFF